MNDHRQSSESCFHVTVLSNFARAFDKYRRRYCKSAIPESSFPDKFFLLRRDELDVGVKKAAMLLKRLARPGDELLVLETTIEKSELQPNTRTGIGRFVPRDWIHVDSVSYLSGQNELVPQTIESVCARSIATLEQEFSPYENLTPRSFSVLPEAIGCQASCPFCFSKASASLETHKARLSHEHVAAVAKLAKQRGATRAVVTGGGEPGMLEHDDLVELVQILSAIYKKTVLITNGFKWGAMDQNARLEHLLTLDAAGLTVLAMSRHHYLAEANSAIMRLDTRANLVADTWRKHKQHFRQLQLRWICVLQKDGISSPTALRKYVEWASLTGVREICFKELYVSTSTESEYHDYKANRWSRENQSPLSLVTEFAEDHDWIEVDRLPWGSPVFRGKHNGHEMQIAAYTEPSLFWERHNKLCRSWNLMADGRCLASLEDKHSGVLQR